jgi:hypothetical protein
MVKKVGLPLLALAALLMVVPAQKANAAVRFGVAVGGPVYAYPAYPGPYAYPYSEPYYNAYPSYVARAPGYVYGYGGRRGNEWREHREHEWREHEWREHERRERREWRGRGEREGRGDRR